MVILFVEDNDAIRKLIRTVLSREGHTVLDVATGEAAVSLVESSTQRIDLLITDVVLPHLTGYDLVRWIRSLHPEILVIYISGYLESELLELTRGDPMAKFLQKPFSPASLLREIQDIAPRSRGNAG